jgi:hypothetical protein
LVQVAEDNRAIFRSLGPVRRDTVSSAFRGSGIRLAMKGCGGTMDQNRTADQDQPNQNANKEQAEGARGKARGSQGQQGNPGRGNQAQPENPGNAIPSQGAGSRQNTERGAGGAGTTGGERNRAGEYGGDKSRGSEQGMDRNRGSESGSSRNVPSDTGSVRNRGSEQGGGITNRPLGEEQEEQSEVPSRGRTKADEGGGNA